MVGVDAAWRVRTLSDVLRKASDSLGRSHLRTAGEVWPLDDLRDHPNGVRCRAVVVGATAAEAGLAADELARLVACQDVAAALKLQPFDPTQAVTWAVRAEPEVERLVGATAGCIATDQIPAYGVPLIEAWGQRHELADRRLFRA
jgi:urease accessory protein